MALSPASSPSSRGSLNAVLPLLEYLEGRGLDPKAVLGRVGIPASALEDARMRLPKGDLEALWQVASDATSDPAIALRVSALAKPSELGVIGYLASASESVRTSLEIVRGLTPLLWEGVDCALESEGEVAFFRCSTGSPESASRFTIEYAIGLTIAMSRLIGAAHSDPLEARFSHAAPGYADEYERILRLPVRFDARESGVLYPIAMMDGSNPAADAALRRVLERHAADELARLETGTRLCQRVRACIRSMLPAADGATADAVAARLRISSRSLRRRLRQEGTHFQAILDDVRSELANHYLAIENRRIDEVAFLLGFSDPSAFTKAFRRWTACTPAAFVRRRAS